MKKSYGQWKRWISGIASEAEILNVTLEDAIALGEDGRALMCLFIQEFHRYLRNYFRSKITKELVALREERSRELSMRFAGKKKERDFNLAAKKIPGLAAKWDAALRK